MFMPLKVLFAGIDPWPYSLHIAVETPPFPVPPPLRPVETRHSSAPPGSHPNKGPDPARGTREPPAATVVRRGDLVRNPTDLG